MPIDLPDYGKASALAMVYLLIAVFVMYFYSKMIKKSERYSVITGKGYRPRKHHLGRWRYPAMIFSLIYLGLAAVLPFAVFLLVSFMNFLQVPSLEAFRTMTLINYSDAIHYPAFGSMIRNTIIMVLVTATATVILSFLVSYAVTRMRFKWSGLLDQLSFVPHTIPGIVSGLAWFWGRVREAVQDNRRDSNPKVTGEKARFVRALRNIFTHERRWSVTREMVSEYHTAGDFSKI